jgi:hypothetical protein
MLWIAIVGATDFVLSRVLAQREPDSLVGGVARSRVAVERVG